MKNLTLSIEGMTCGGCVNSVKRALANFPGIQKVEVSLEKGQATLEYDPAQVSPDQLKTAIEESGYDVSI